MSKPTKYLKKQLKKTGELTFGTGLNCSIDTKKRYARKSYNFSGNSNFYSPADQIAYQIKDKIESSLKNGDVVSVDPKGLNVEQLNGYENKKFKARIIIRKYKEVIPLFRIFSKKIYLTDKMINIVFDIYENQIKPAEASL